MVVNNGSNIGIHVSEATSDGIKALALEAHLVLYRQFQAIGCYRSKSDCR